jgi:hypothetical protein
MLIKVTENQFRGSFMQLEIQEQYLLYGLACPNRLQVIMR